MKKILTIILVLALTAGLAACGGGSGEEGESGTKQITIASPQPNNEDDPVYVYCKTFMDTVTEKTDGAITFEIQGDGILGDDVEIAEGLALGTLDMGVTSNAAIASYDPAHELYALPFIFNDDCVEAFEILKKALISAPIVQPPDWNLPFEIMCDASDYAVGAVLGQ